MKPRIVILWLFLFGIFAILFRVFEPNTNQVNVNEPEKAVQSKVQKPSRQIASVPKIDLGKKTQFEEPKRESNPPKGIIHGGYSKSLFAGNIVFSENKKVKSSGLNRKVTLYAPTDRYGWVRTEESQYRDEKGVIQSRVAVMTGDQVMVRLAEGSTEDELEQLARRLGAEIEKNLTDSRVYVLKFNGSKPENWNLIYSELKKSKEVAYAEPNYFVAAQ